MYLEESVTKWKQFQSGNDDAYGWLYTTYIQVLFGYGLRFTSDNEIIKDCIHDVFIDLYKNKEKLITPSNVKVYLFVSLKNRLVKVLYKNSLFERIDSEKVNFTLETTVEEQFIDEEQEHLQQTKIQHILDSLTPRQREIIYYRYIQGLTLDEICIIMDMNYQSTQNLIQRSLKKIKEKYGTIGIFLLLLSILLK